jgi:putative phosphoribosyl transferase
VADRVVCLESPHWFSAVGQAYRDFAQVSDDEVVARLEASRAPELAVGADVEEDVEVQADVGLPGSLTLPVAARAVVLFAHGSGSSRHSPRNRQVARRLNRAGLGTLLFDLLTPEEARERDLVFAIELLGDRLRQATTWLRRHLADRAPAVGYFGASTGAAAALWAAADPTAGIGAVVSRGGRPDLAAPRLHLVRAPTLLIVGGADEVVLELNRRAEAMLPGEVRLAVVPGAGHLFEQPGELDTVADLAAGWFTRHLDLPAGATSRG